MFLLSCVIRDPVVKEGTKGRKFGNHGLLLRQTSGDAAQHCTAFPNNLQPFSQHGAVCVTQLFV